VKVAWELWRKPAKWPKSFATPQRDISDKVVRGVKARFIGHATVLLQVGGLNILTDPVFFDSVGLNRVLGQRRVSDAGTRPEGLPHIDVILISHNHYDHLDLPSIERIAGQQGNTPPRGDFLPANSDLYPTIGRDISCAIEMGLISGFGMNSFQIDPVRSFRIMTVIGA
jgi:Beta-lactamase superfamily domain